MPRTRRNRITDADFVRALQIIRLQGLETGEYQPLSDRETFYLRLFQSGRRPDREDFILSSPLFQLEAAQIRSDDDTPDAEPFTPSPETAISPA
ncbi:MAG: hypothetical protein KKG14_03650 [Alphaproteobacteria bacterium]|nr:hypothetical protein [Alphaproteobacteria bacterium]MBU2271934.1 hypothetical protein [Alphaproteobacteria bacterium]MBU2417776.1 hypothetical protein [Alphaproteobacteria bacterium]